MPENPRPEQPPSTQAVEAKSERSAGEKATHNGDDSKSSWVARFGLAISLLALLFSAFSFYWNSWRSAAIKIKPGDAIFISYGYEGNLGIIVPLVYSNQGALAGVVNNIRLACGKQGAKDATPLYAVYYVKLGRPNQMDSFAVPEQIKGGEQLTRLILFWSGVDRVKTGDFNVGNYACGVIASDDSGPAREFARFSFPIRQEDINQLKNHPPSETNRFIYTHESGVTEIVLREPYN